MIRDSLKEKMLRDLGIDISSVLLPNRKTDMRRWAVVACDQYTSEPEYWMEVENFVGNSPSALRLIFPETFLETESDAEKSSRINKINETMREYLRNDLFESFGDTVVLVERTFANGGSRKGLVLSVDLERYDYAKGSQSLIRATEGTILERLPPRIRIRENAALELPHIMLLIDDRNHTVIEPLMEKYRNSVPVYSFELMKNSGSIKGWAIKEESDFEHLTESLSELSNPQAFKERYQVDDSYGVLLFAVGDGNHSLATAKACWESLKKTLSAKDIVNHPARFALVEVVNVHDAGLVFEPIHRILFNVDASHLAQAFCAYYKEKGCHAFVGGEHQQPSPHGHWIRFVSEKRNGYLVAEKPLYNLDVATLQAFLDQYLRENPKVGIDYVHGEDITHKLGTAPGNMGLFLSPMDKKELFKTVILDGALPRKSFSMGEASEKRFYLEARKIR